MDSELTGRAVLVTGASGGIGSATVRAFAAEGARTVIHYNSNRGAATSLAESLAAPATIVQADLTNEAQVDTLFADAIGAEGRLDAVVVNAGVWPEPDEMLHQISLERWRATMEADLTSAFLTCRGFMRHLEADPREEAAIVLIASTAALFGEAGHSDYSAAKAAMAYGMNRTLKNEIVRLAPRGRVNCVCPGWTATPMAEDALKDQAVVDRVLATMPMKKVATADDIARVIVFLSSSALSGHISGAVVPVAGGMEGRLQTPR